MPIKRVQFPEGSVRRIEGPEGATDEQIIEFAQPQYRPTATYVVTAPDDQEYEVDAPADAAEDEVLAYARQNYPNADVHPRQSCLGDIPVEAPSHDRPWTRYQQDSRSGGIPVDEHIDLSQVKWDRAPPERAVSRPNVEGATEAQLIAALRRADAAGDVPAARAIARRIQSMGAFGTQTPGSFDDLPMATNSTSSGGDFDDIPIAHKPTAKGRANSEGTRALQLAEDVAAEEVNSRCSGSCEAHGADA